MSPPTRYLTTNIVGGLGNQLFLVANLLATARRHAVPAYLPRLSLSSSCEAPRPTYWNSIFSNLHTSFDVVSDLPESMLNACEVIEVRESRPLRPIRLPPPAECAAPSGSLYRMIGFFQSESMFRDFPVIKDVIPPPLHQLAAAHLQEFYVKPFLSRGSRIQDGGLSLREEDERCRMMHLMGLHIRRGDYVRMRDVFAYLQLEHYYDAALRRLLGHRLSSEMSRKRAAPVHLHVLIFCEDLAEARRATGYFRCKYPGLTVTHVHSSHEVDPTAPEEATRVFSDSRAEGTSVARQALLEAAKDVPREVLELLMLAHCHDVVMANSSFSWWSAYLGEEPFQRVVAPSQWFTGKPFAEYHHLYADSWMIL